jgi:hypothetical protein
MSDCFGAGTGCGWCRTYLRRLFEQETQARLKRTEPPTEGEPTAKEYAQARARYVRAGGGTPPAGATPIDESEQE